MARTLFIVETEKGFILQPDDCGLFEFRADEVIACSELGSQYSYSRNSVLETVADYFSAPKKESTE